MIDTHCHLLPGVDDGSPNMAVTIEMATIAYKDGIRKIVATPHVYNPGFSFHMIREKTEHLNSILKSRGLDLEIYPGAEIVTGLNSEIIKQY